MQIHYDTSKSQLLVLLDGEIDHHTSVLLRAEIDAAVYAHMPRTLILDFHQVTFMDSSGIGLIMGRYKIIQPMGGEIILQKPSPYISRVLRLAGMERLAQITNTTSPEEVAS